MSFPDDIRPQYDAVRAGRGILDRSATGTLAVTGGDRASWLQGMVTNDMRPLTAGAPRIQACILDVTGHIVADLAVVNAGDRLLIDLAPALVEPIVDLLDTYIITEDVEIQDVTAAMACLSAQGALWTPAEVTDASGEGAIVVAADHSGSGGFDIYVPADRRAVTRERLLAFGGVEVGAEVAEILRVEAGLPRFGADLDSGVIPLEAGLEPTHISHHKGCYIGQEIIARIHSRGHTNRALTGLAVAGAVLPERGAEIRSAGLPGDGGDAAARAVGWVTSAVRSPAFGAIALAYVRHECRQPGTTLEIGSAAGVIQATVVDLPFYRRSNGA